MKTVSIFAAAGVALALFGCAPKPEPAKVEKSVMKVLTYYDEKHGASGTAFVVSDKYLVTNYHVVKNGLRFELMASGLKKAMTARVVVASPTLDIAVLSTAEDLNRPALVLDLSPPPPGSAVYAMGYPGAADELARSEESAEDASVTNGNLSRAVLGSWPNGQYQFPMIVHTAPINHGNSGGPLMDACNHVIGVNTASLGSPVEIGFDENHKLVGVADVVAGVYQASGSSELAKYLKEQGITVKTVAAACGGPIKLSAGPIAGGGVVLAALGAGGFLLYRRRDKLAAALKRKTADPVGGTANLPPRGLRLVGAGAGGAMTVDVPRERFANTLGVVTVGRNPQLVDVVIQSRHPADKDADETISRAHARFLWKNDSFYIEDYGRSGEGSSNKTYLNGLELAPASPQKVRAGDKVRFGKHEFQIFDL